VAIIDSNGTSLAIKMGQRVFVREATGLVKEFGSVDALLMASAAVFALVFTTLQFPWFYGFNPGANLPLALVLAAIPFLILMLCYWGIGVLMPRAGNDYIWVSRLLHPTVGFSWSALYMFSVFVTAYVGGTAAYAYAISTSLSIWGRLYGLTGLSSAGDWLSAPVGELALSVLLTLLFAVLSLFGSRAVRRFLYIFWGIEIVGIVVMWGLLAAASPALLASNWNRVLGQFVTYDGLVEQATRSGWSGAPGGLQATLASLPLAALFLFGGNFVDVIAGEIKGVRRAIPLALLLSLFFGIAYWSITAALTLKATGENWMYAVGYLWDNNQTAYSSVMPYPPTEPLLLALISYPNQALTALAILTYLVGSAVAPFVYFWIPTRYFFAWSFDRIIPTRFADVHQRYHAPHYSIAAISGLAAVLFVLYYFTSWPTAFALGTFLWGISFVVPGIAALLLPLRRPGLLEGAPGFLRRRLLGMPLLSLLGLLTALSFAYLGYVAITNPLISTPTTLGVAVVIGIILITLAIYFRSRAYHARRGLDINLIFRELPPE